MMGRMRYLFQFRRGIFFELKPDIGQTVPAVEILEGYTFDLIPRGLFKKDPIFSEKNRSREFYDRLDKHSLCYGYFAQDKSVASYLWLTIPDEKIVICWECGLKMVIRPSIAYVWDCFTAPRYRGQGLYKYGLRNAVTISSKRGAGNIYISSVEDNTYSIKGIISAGFKKSFAFSILGIGPIRLIKKSSRPINWALKGQRYDVLGN